MKPENIEKYIFISRLFFHLTYTAIISNHAKAALFILKYDK